MLNEVMAALRDLARGLCNLLADLFSEKEAEPVYWIDGTPLPIPPLAQAMLRIPEIQAHQRIVDAAQVSVTDAPVVPTDIAQQNTLPIPAQGRQWLLNANLAQQPQPPRLFRGGWEPAPEVEARYYEGLAQRMDARDAREEMERRRAMANLMTRWRDAYSIIRLAPMNRRAAYDQRIESLVTVITATSAEDFVASWLSDEARQTAQTLAWYRSWDGPIALDVETLLDAAFFVAFSRRVFTLAQVAGNSNDNLGDSATPA